MRFISIDQLKEGMVLAQNVYDPSLKLLLRAGNTLTSKHISRVLDFGYQGIYIDDDLSKDIEITDIVSDELRVAAFTTVKAACIHAYHYSKNSSKEASNVDKHFQATKTLTNKIIADMKKRDVEHVNLIDLKFFDDYIVSHNVNVGVLSLFLGKSIGLSSVELQRLGIAAFLHDVGKMFLDPRILNKVGKLSDEEHQQVNMHSSHSYRYIKECYHIHSSTYLGILYHHEKNDGTGYPKGLKGNNIPLYSRIISICDVYDALTSNRPNRPPLQPSEAFEYLMAAGESSFDVDLLYKFMDIIAPYPKGMKIKLSNGEKGIIVENKKHMVLRPTVRIIKSSEGKYIEPFDVELSEDPKYRNVIITDIYHANKG